MSTEAARMSKSRDGSHDGSGDDNRKGDSEEKSMENQNMSPSKVGGEGGAGSVVNIGTRRSELARRQTAIVEEALRRAWRRPSATSEVEVEAGVGVGVVSSTSTSASTLVPTLPSAFGATEDIRFVVHAMSTAGDKNQVTALHEFGAKALWTQELEMGLLEGSLDMVVHSLKGEFHFILFFGFVLDWAGGDVVICYNSV